MPGFFFDKNFMKNKNNKLKKVKVITQIFEEWMPVPQTELLHENVYELTVAVILSAQCTDKRVNLITPLFYKEFPTVYSLAEASFEQVFEIIKSCSYPNNKAKHLIGMAQKVVSDYCGIIPSSRDELQKIPGIGRKTANVIASVAFGEETMPVDTHVFRVAQRIGLVNQSKTPLEVENQLVEVIEKNLLHNFHHWLIFHGRYICQARKPKCEKCRIHSFCDYFIKIKKNTFQK